MKKILAVVLVIFAMGCAKKYVQPQDLEKEMAEEKVMAEEEIIEAKITPEEAREVEISEVEETLFEFKDALFDFDKYDIRPDARMVLDSVAEWLNAQKDINVLIEGHCDERGTNEYNLALGERRAKAARDYLISRGVAHIRMSIITYGEERPACFVQNEGCWQNNRRAHFVVTR
jgi:peptidoglycan-associated lipoprotein